jgi:hypothetical protein
VKHLPKYIVFVMATLPFLIMAFACGVSEPSKPIRVIATNSGEDVKVSWSPPTDGTGGKVDKYVVTANPGRISVEVSGRTLEATIKDLDKEVPYTFTVQAKNESGSSEISELSTEVKTLQVPAKPERVIAELRNNAVLIKWQPPKDTSLVTNYTVVSNPPTRAVRVPGDENQALLQNLRSGVSYAFSVFATNQMGDGNQSDYSEEIIPVGLPDAPSILEVQPEDSAAVVTWAHPRSDGGKPISRYVIEATPGRVTSRVGADQTSVVVQNLTNGTEYTFTVMAITEVGQGEKSRPSPPVLVSDRAERSGK